MNICARGKAGHYVQNYLNLEKTTVDYSISKITAFGNVLIYYKPFSGSDKISHGFTRI
jgi:hypothetical protein